MDLVHLEFFKMLCCDNILRDYYLISKTGEIFNVSRKRFVKSHPDKDGYLHLMLCTNEVLPNGNHKRVDFRVAKLVAKTFIGEPPKDMVDPTIDHIDGDILNNAYDNLRWIERSINSSIRINRGVGEHNHEAKLKAEQVITVCQLIEIGTPLKCIATLFNVSPSTISNIKQRKNWTHISKDYVWN